MRPWFCPKLIVFLLSTWFPHRLESEDHARPWFCPKLMIFLLSTWFPHRLESEDHARPWFYPKLMIFLCIYLFFEGQPLDHSGESWLEAGSP